MPKEPILDREIIVESLRKDGTLQTLDFCIVNTSLGGMIEPRPVARMPEDFSSAADSLDNSYNRINVIGDISDLGEMLTLTNGLQTPSSW